VPVDDHSLAAGEFEGVHEGQRRGTGAVISWDEGTADIVRDEPGHVSFIWPLELNRDRYMECLPCVINVVGRLVALRNGQSADCDHLVAERCVSLPGKTMRGPDDLDL
jgi:hypothetical protein